MRAAPTPAAPALATRPASAGTGGNTAPVPRGGPSVTRSNGCLPPLAGPGGPRDPKPAVGAVRPTGRHAATSPAAHAPSDPPAARAPERRPRRRGPAFARGGRVGDAAGRWRVELPRARSCAAGPVTWRPPGPRPARGTAARQATRAGPFRPGMPARSAGKGRTISARFLRAPAPLPWRAGRTGGRRWSGSAGRSGPHGAERFVWLAAVEAAPDRPRRGRSCDGRGTAAQSCASRLRPPPVPRKGCAPRIPQGGAP